MFLGDIVTITRNGIIVREKALQPLGIYDQSICWGMWAANPHTRHPSHRHPNLIISPFHPSSWPFLIRLRIVLENRKGALADAARLLEKNDLSIVFAECTPTGFTHATWTVIAESTWDKLEDLRKEKEQFDKKYPKVRIPPRDEEPPDRSYEEARDLASRIAAPMLSHVRQIEGVFDGVRQRQEPGGDAPTGPPLLHVWRADENSHFLYDGDAVAREMERLKQGTFDANLDYIRSQVPGPADVKYMQRLAYFSLYGGGEFNEVPFRFRYRADTTVIKMTEQGTPFGEGSFKLAPLPMPAIGTFNSEDKYLRLCPVTPSFLARPLTRIIVSYEVKQQPTHNAKASQGLLRRVSDALRDDVNLLHISNKWTRHGYANEKGEISFIADVEPEGHRELERKLRAVNDGESDRLEAVTIKGARVYEYALKRLFLSIHFEHPRERCVRQLVERAALDEGFVNVVVETYTNAVTQEVDEKIANCQAFLQLLYSEKDPYEINLQWLQHEYSTARAKGIPALRLVDTSRFTYERWRSRLVVNADHPLRKFRLDVSDEDLGEVIRKAIRELAKKTLPPDRR